MSQKKPPKEQYLKKLSSNEANNGKPKERYISPQKRQRTIDGLRLV